MKKFLVLCLLFSSSVFANIAHEKAVVRVVNRLKGINKSIEISVGEKTLFENISINVEACYEKPRAVGIESTHWGFLQIKDLEKESSPENSILFSGWMPSHDRNISTLEHPVYDIWIERCE
ncbi:MAG: DUF2155 domain-containing protein [Alphaproteobacteria bacterium]